VGAPVFWSVRSTRGKKLKIKKLKKASETLKPGRRSCILGCSVNSRRGFEARVSMHERTNAFRQQSPIDLPFGAKTCACV